MFKLATVLAFLAAIASVVSAEVYFEERFDGASRARRSRRRRSSFFDRGTSLRNAIDRSIDRSIGRSRDVRSPSIASAAIASRALAIPS
jgi:hypothetical protein